jgi:hypothetical protein
MSKPVATTMRKLQVLPVATLIVLTIAIAGGIETIIRPEVLPFVKYVEYVGIAAGLLGIGRGLDATHRP